MTDADAARWVVEVVYAAPERQRLVSVSVPAGARVAEAIAVSGVLQEFPEIDLTSNRVGIFGQLTRLDEVLRDGDRVEIYRPLIADPKEARRKRAASRRAAGKGG